LKMLTLIETEEIDEIVEKHLESPELREWQKLLAYKVIEIIHGYTQAELALKISDFMFWNWDKIKTLAELNTEELSTFQNAMGGLVYTEQNFFELIVSSWLSKSNSEARNAVQSGAISINGEKIADMKYDFSWDFLENWSLLLQKGKKNLRVIRK
jgi:tyrosyl-tRNA synthetase